MGSTLDLALAVRPFRLRRGATRSSFVLAPYLCPFPQRSEEPNAGCICCVRSVCVRDAGSRRSHGADRARRAAWGRRADRLAWRYRPIWQSRSARRARRTRNTRQAGATRNSGRAWSARTTRSRRTDGATGGDRKHGRCWADWSSGRDRCRQEPRAVSSRETPLGLRSARCCLRLRCRPAR